MIEEFVKNWEAKKDLLRDKYSQEEPRSYNDIVKDVVELVSDDECGKIRLNHEKITIIDDGDYQGTLLYIIPQACYQPSVYYSVFVDYGSCSGCDTFEDICSGSDKEQRVNDFMQLALHIVQDLKQI